MKSDDRFWWALPVRVLLLLALVIYLLVMRCSAAKANPFIDQPWGDVNCSGSVNIADAVLLLAYIFDGASIPDCANVDAIVSAHMMAPGNVGNPTIAEAYRVVRTPLFGDSIPDLFLDVPVDSGQLAGDQVNFELPYPRNGMWYRLTVIFKVDSLWYPADSIKIRSSDYELAEE